MTRPQAVLYAHDLDRMAAFYRECLNFVPASTGEDHRELRSGDLTLWLVQGRAPAPCLDADGSPVRRSEVALKLGLGVASIDRAAAEVANFGGRATTTTWEFGGCRRRDVIDPEGNVIQLLEPVPTAEP